ncbi:MAG TPA: hypothetical protein PKL31_04480 [Fulvivirga sp.]|nr:hypothetical protein [Fulvivirga sp.]
MAKKKNDDIEDNKDLNKEDQNDFNEADDSFGLPDVDYQPLDESEEEPDKSSDDFSSESEESVNEDAKVESTYIPGSYTPPQQESSNGGKIFALILVLLLVGAGIWYFGFYAPAQKIEKARIEKQKQEAETARIAAEKRAEEERLAQQAADREAERLAAEEAAKPKIGTVETITGRTGRYYVVIASVIDGDLAMDYANKLKKTGVSLQIIPPFGKSKFHRVAVDNLDSWAAAENRANEMKSEYGENVWVIKY